MAFVLGSALAGAGPAAAQFIGEEAPRFRGADLEGRPFDAATVIGKQPVLLVFWASW